MADAGTVHSEMPSAADGTGPLEPDFRQLLERLPVGAYLCDPTGRIVYYNERAAELWGRQPDLHDGAHRFCGSLRLFTVDGQPLRHDQCWMALALEDQVSYEGREIVIERPDGTRLTALAHANPLRSEDGAVVGAINVLLDISERQRGEERQRELEAALAHLGRLGLAGEMAAGFAHELNQPLTSIANHGAACINRLRSGETALDDVLDSLQRIVEQAEHAGEVIRRLRGFTRQTAPHQQIVDLGALIGETLRFVAMDAREAQVELCPELPDGAVPVWADRVQIQQVLVNLIRNGIEAMAANAPETPRKLRIIAEAAAAEVAVSVTDTGPGIPPSTGERLFYPFVTSRPQGMGLGLAITRAIVEAHGGRLWLAEAGGAPGKGACLRFTLPRPPEGRQGDSG
ncbi:two-component system sensor histidine kinase NtrB [Spiribacter halobius]|nr:ATP-binding protein [Spiribacter halobius]UEX77922.1 PAS domain-containing protein [Spiribacter halobius]